VRPCSPVHLPLHASLRSRVASRQLLVVAFAAFAVSAPVHAQVGAASAGEMREASRETDASAIPRLAGEIARPRAFAALSASVGALRDSMVSRAKESVGIKYLLGGNNPLRGLDCSALIRHIVSAFDISLPRTAQEQARMGREIPKDRSAMRPGDLLTFGRGARITHVGMYVGEGRFIHASTSKRRVIESSLDAKSSLVREWKGVRRLVDGDFVAARYDSVFAFLDSLGITGGDTTAAARNRR
jgi:cell wall-associated NlpC family hydrolase